MKFKMAQIPSTAAISKESANSLEDCKRHEAKGTTPEMLCHSLFSLAIFGRNARQKPGYGMSENHGHS
jgi:hypothetical protein